MANDLIIPEILLINKLEETDNALSPQVWEQMRQDIIIYEQENPVSIIADTKKRMFFSDFINKVISKPIEVSPNLNDETKKQLYRLHLFCCQEAIHYDEVRHNPFILGFHALGEMKTALKAIMLSHRLTDPSCPYSWSEDFFEKHIITDKTSTGNTIIRFLGIPTNNLEKAINEDIVSDWLIYRKFDNNGIKTLMDIKNNLLTLPDYQRGGRPAVEFSRFQRKMAEQRNRKEIKKADALDLEFRKTLVQSVAEKTAEKLLSSGLSANEILAKAFSENLEALTNLAERTSTIENQTPSYNQYTLSSENKTCLSPNSIPQIEDKSTTTIRNQAKSLMKETSKKQNTKDIENIIAELLEDDN